MSTPSAELQPPPVGPPGGAVPAAGQTNTLAVVSLVTGLFAPLGHFIGVGGITLIIVSIVTGHMARRQISQTGERGDALALAGLIISYAHLAVILLVVVFFFGFIIAVLGALIALGAAWH